MRRAALILAYLATVAAVAWGVHRAELHDALDAAAAGGRADLDLAVERLVLELQRSRDVAVLLADAARIRDRLDGGPTASAARLLRRTADRTRSADILLVDPDGAIRASATGRTGSIAGAPWFRRAMQGALGGGPDVGRAYTHGAPVFGPDGRVAGAIVVVRDLGRIEADWRAEPHAFTFSTPYGRVVASSRTELLNGPPTQDLAPELGHDLRRIEGGRYVPQDALHVARDVPVLGLVADLYADAAPARALAFARAGIVAAALLVLGAALLFLWERRRTLARANAMLEARVAARTEALTAEIQERREAEAALTRTQADLVQATKLGALGRMSAGISHELNQPLMAIRSFAQNGATFLERGRAEAAADNLRRIDDLARRAGRIIANLRAFARAEPQPASPTDLRAVLDDALDVTAPRRAGLETVVRAPDAPVMAMGGEVRLGQVLANLIANAADAMDGQGVLTLTLTDGPPTLTVADTGPGLADPDRVFDPFYTTKEVGAGLGLGLSLSYGIVEGFGGTLTARNGARGAVFEVVLRPADAASEPMAAE